MANVTASCSTFSSSAALKGPENPLYPPVNTRPHMNHLLRSFIKGLLAVLLFGTSGIAAEPGLKENARIVFIGDSITGQGGGWLGTGYVFKMRDALRAVYPEAQQELVPLGGSGMGVGAWLGLAKDEAKQRQNRGTTWM